MADDHIPQTAEEIGRPAPPSLTRYTAALEYGNDSRFMVLQTEAGDEPEVGDVLVPLIEVDAVLAALRSERDRLQRDSDILRKCNIVEIAVANETGSVGEYMEHWEGRALKAEAEVARLEAEQGALRTQCEAREAALRSALERLPRYEAKDTAKELINRGRGHKASPLVGIWRESNSGVDPVVRWSDLENLLAALLAAPQGET